MDLKLSELVDSSGERLGEAVGVARKVAEGGTAIGTEEPRVRQATIASREGVYPKEVDWRTLGEAGDTLAAE